MLVYDAFISYSHAKDKPVATALQSVIQTLGRKWWQRRVLRVFRDDSSLAASPHLWPDIQAALDQSRYLILLASPDAAASIWVNKEVAHWLTTKGSNTVLIAVTDGTLAWDPSLNDFNWMGPNPLPPAMKGAFRDEPKWVDLSAHRASGTASRRNPDFVSRAADIAATVQGIPKEDLISEELAQQRRALRTAYAGLAGLAVLAGGAAYEAWQTTLAKNRAELVLEQGTVSTNNLVSALAQRFRGHTNIPQNLVIGLLNEAHDLVQGLSKASGKQPEPELERTQGYALAELSKSFRTEGDAPKAQEAASEAVAIFERLSKFKKTAADWHTGLATSYDRLGDALSDMNRVKEAADAYDNSRAILEGVATTSGAAATLTDQRNLAVAIEKQGGMLLANGQTTQGLAALRRSLDLRRTLVAANPDRHDIERDEEVSHVKIAEALARLGQANEASAEYQSALTIAARLALVEGTSLDFRRDLLVVHRGLADIAHQQGDEQQAFEHLQLALPIAETLAANDPDRMEWQDDFISIADRVGDRLRQDKKFADAAAIFERALSASKRRTAKDQTRADWQWGLAIAYKKVGDSLRDAGRPKDAVAAYRESLSVRRRTSVLDNRRAEFDAQIAQNFQMISNALVEDNNPTEALAVAQERVAWSQGPVAPQTETRAFALGSASWFALLARDTVAALTAADASIALLPDQLWLHANRAHALMYANQLDAAREEYLAHKGKMATGRQSWETYIADDFTQLRGAGLDHRLMRDIEAELK